MPRNFKINRKNSFTYLLFALMILLLLVHPADNRHLVQDNLLRETETDISTIMDSTISSGRYRLIKDSLERIKTWKKWRLIAVGDGAISDLVGVRKISECDSCEEPFSTPKMRDQFHSKYFLDLPGFTLKPDASFFIEKDKYFIKYNVTDKVHDKVSYGHYEIKQIPVRFKSEFERNKNLHTALLVPISKTMYQIVNILYWIFFFALILLSIWYLIAFVGTVFSIANGRAFTLQNVRNLRFIAWFTIIPIFIPILFALICKLLMHHKIPNEIYFPFWLYLYDHKEWLIAGLITL